MSYRQYINPYGGKRGSKRQHIASLKKYADFYREVSPPDSLSSFTTGTPVGDSENPDGTEDHSALPNGDSARNIGRPSPDSPNLKYRNLDKSEANGRTPGNKLDLGYVHDSGSGSARVIPYDSGFVNNSSPLRNASRVASRFRMRRGSLTNLSQQIKREYGVELSLLDNGEIIELIKIVIPKDQRGLGLGSKIMGEITAWADQKGKIISLTPSKDFGGSSVSRLVRFYSQFGFKKNKGRNKDFRTRDTMLRYPSEAQGGKVAGLIRPPKKLIDEVALIAQGAVARWLLKKRSPNPNLYFDELTILEITNLFDTFSDLILDIQREDSDLEDTEWILNALRIEFNKYHKQLLDLERASNEVFGVIGGLKHAISILEGIDVNLLQASPHEYVKEITRVSNTTETLLWLMERNQEKPLISSDALKDYEKASSKLPSGYSLYGEWGIQYPTMYPIKILMEFEDHKNFARGTYSLNKRHSAYGGPQHTITFYVSPTKRGWTKEDLQGVRNTSRHELVHALQIEHKRKKHKDDKGEAGLPFKKRQDDYRHYWKEKEESLKREYKREGVGNPDFISIHALDDIEFYSRLLDEVVKFQRSPSNTTNEDIRFHLKYSEFFMNLKRFQKKKYNKAVGIFISEVQSNSRKASEKSGGLIRPPKKDMDLVYDAYLYLVKKEIKSTMKFTDLFYKVLSQKGAEYFEEEVMDGEFIYELEDMEGSPLEEIRDYILSYEGKLKREVEELKSYFDPDDEWELMLKYFFWELEHVREGRFSKWTTSYRKRIINLENYVGKILDPFDSEEIKRYYSLNPKGVWRTKKPNVFTNYSKLVEIPAKRLVGFNYPIHLCIGTDEGWRGSYEWRERDRHHIIKVDYDKFMGYAAGIIRHELVHALQSELNMEHKITTGGLPSKIRGEYEHQDRFRERELKGKARREGIDPDFISIHALDDAEFYTRLLDEVVDFRSNPDQSNRGIRNALKSSIFFVSLKRFQKKKYNKAVGIFISEAQSNTRKASEVLAGLIKPPQHLLNIVSDFAQGILARYVLKQPSTILAIEDAEWIDETLEDLKDLNSFEDAEELYELLEDFRMEYWDLKKEVLNDYEIPYQVAHHAKMIELKLKEVTGWDQAHTPIKDRIKSVLSKSNKDIIERDLVLSLKVVSDHIKAVQNKIPHKDDNAFKQALSKLNVGYISKDSFYSVDAIIEDETLSLPIDLTIFFEGKRKVLGSHRLIEGKSHRIKIYVPIQRGLSKKDLVQTHNTVRHELVHLVQSEITIRNKLNHDAGLPSSKRGRKYMQHKKEEEAELRSQFRAMGLDPSVVNFHALDDAEFYTRLLDEVEEFKSDYISPTNDQIKRHIRRSSFFRSLKRFKKKNWSKAVGIFISEAQSNTRKASEK